MGIELEGEDAAGVGVREADEVPALRAAETGDDRDVLLAVHLVADRRRHHAGSRVALPQALRRWLPRMPAACPTSFPGTPGRRAVASTPAGMPCPSSTRHACRAFTGSQAVRCVRTFCCGERLDALDASAATPPQSSLVFMKPRLPAERRVGREVVDRLERRDVDEARSRAERHRMPVVAARDAGRDARARSSDQRASGRSTGRPVARSTSGRPRHVDVRVRRQQLAGRAVEHVEEAVLRRLHQHLAERAGSRRRRSRRSLRRITRSASTMCCVAV